MELFLQELDSTIQESIKRVDSKVKFRFGNGAHLTSECRILLPLISGEDQKRLWLTIEVAPGSTPFLFSKRAFKLLGGALDTRSDTCFLHRLKRKLHLDVNKSGLYLLNVAELCSRPSSGHQVPSHETSDFVGFSSLSSNVSESQRSKQVKTSKCLDRAHPRPFGNAATCQDHPGDSTGVGGPNPSPLDASALQSPDHGESDSHRCRRGHAGQRTPDHAHRTPEPTPEPEGHVGRCFRTASKSERRFQSGKSWNNAQSSITESSSRTSSSIGDLGDSVGTQVQAVTTPVPTMTPAAVSTVRATGTSSSTPMPSMSTPGTATSQPLTDQHVQAWPVIPEPDQLPNLPPALGVWGTKPIGWGKKHKGKDYRTVRNEDPGYVQWLIQRFGSLTPEQKDYVAYVRSMNTWLRTVQQGQTANRIPIP